MMQSENRSGQLESVQPTHLQTISLVLDTLRNVSETSAQVIHDRRRLAHSKIAVGKHRASLRRELCVGHVFAERFLGGSDIIALELIVLVIRRAQIRDFESA